jgi:uncharacterized protein (TIGR03083 family)
MQEQFMTATPRAARNAWEKEHRMHYEEHIEHFRLEAHRFADTLAAADLNTMVLTCPEWSVRELARHVGHLHRWATTIVQQRMRAETWPRDVSFEYPDDTDTWVEWIRDGIDPAVRAFWSTDPSQRVWTWGADQHARFWPRRMLFETAVHRLDLDLTHQQPVEVSPEVAVEGIDEWFENLRHVGRWRPPIAKLAGDNRRLSFATTDTADTWRVWLTPAGWWWDRGTTPGHTHVVAPASDLLLLLQGRPAAHIHTDGDDQILQNWLVATVF